MTEDVGIGRSNGVGGVSIYNLWKRCEVMDTEVVERDDGGGGGYTRR